MAANLTTQAGLVLYEYLIELGYSVMYCETDCLIYIHIVDEPPKVRTGVKLVHLTDELEVFGSGFYIEDFVSGGPKNYGFSVFCSSTRKRTTKCKVKSINFDYEKSMTVNFTNLNDIILKATTTLHVHKSKIKKKQKVSCLHLRQRSRKSSF